MDEETKQLPTPTYAGVDEDGDLFFEWVTDACRLGLTVGAGEQTWYYVSLDGSDMGSLEERSKDFIIYLEETINKDKDNNE